MSKRARGDHRNRVRFYPKGADKPGASMAVRTTSIRPSGTVFKRKRKLPLTQEQLLQLQEMHRVQMIKPRRSDFAPVDPVTCGQLVSKEEKLYTWRGMANKQARRLALRIKDQIPSDAYFNKISGFR